MAFIFIGILATLFMDLWALTLKKIFSISGLDYRFVGRWVYHFKNLKYFHESIFQSSAYKHEQFLGTFTHYAIGIIFAKVLLLWQQNPSLIHCLAIGVITLIAPLFIMQPAFGMGIGASKMPAKFIIWLKSFNAHVSYGLGLYLASRLILR
ncbi:DUF2938 family protein [Halobacteriovorax sp. GB3]|uniref:DUF2938 family protein n=1 Tax=Halobacteriovorax sp. GB3 TaxID=2719615 RepID=UPI00236170F2|nr:DUF2938 family protein [Halobacteriovorax sp. GB3]MDD0853634.1 DUF2938 family protein [Halobacteriovorax sp. GB3]